MDASRVPLERGTQPSRVCVPQADRGVDAPTGNEATVLAYRDTAYRASVAQERHQHSPAYGIPQSHSLVFAAADHQPAIATQGNRPYPISLPLEGRQRLTIRRFPEPSRSVIAATGDQMAFRC